TRRADLAAMETMYRELTARGLTALARDGVPAGKVAVSRLADMRYRGQAFELQVPVPPGPMSPAAVDAAVDAFHDLYTQIYGHCSREDEVEFVTLRAVCTYVVPRPPSTGTAGRPGAAARQAERSLSGARKGTRLAYFGGQRHGVPLYERAFLPAEDRIEGPAIVEQPDSTVVIYPGQTAHVDATGNLILELGERCAPEEVGWP
ncbi:MAG: hypothetical protein HY691_15585, partial [Chloroflexi bacterium]|nr:hypothetical protein [Chloroflexota bacterium]